MALQLLCNSRVLSCPGLGTVLFPFNLTVNTSLMAGLRDLRLRPLNLKFLAVLALA